MDWMDDAFDGVCAGLGETESEQVLLNKLYDVTLAVLSGISGREVEELRGTISNAEQAISAKVDQACTINKSDPRSKLLGIQEGRLEKR